VTAIHRQSFKAAFVLWVVKFAPQRLTRKLGEYLAIVMWLRRGKSVQVLEANIHAALGGNVGHEELRKMSRMNVINYLDCLFEVCQVPSMSQSDLASAFSIEGIERIKSHLDSGNGLILAVPRTGNIELFAGWLAANVGPFLTVAAQHESRFLDEILSAGRSRFDFRVLTIDAQKASATKSKSPFFALSRHLGGGGLVCIICDVDRSRRGVKVKFFHRWARFSAGPAVLSLRTGAPIITGAIWKADGIYKGKTAQDTLAVPPQMSWKESVAQLTQAIANELEEYIVNHPADWHQFNEVFSTNEFLFNYLNQ
jgi:phosphatidylinositol dimannoside acyltransferase